MPTFALVKWLLTTKHAMPLAIIFDDLLPRQLEKYLNILLDFYHTSNNDISITFVCQKASIISPKLRVCINTWTVIETSRSSQSKNMDIDDIDKSLVTAVKLPVIALHSKHMEENRFMFGINDSEFTHMFLEMANNDITDVVVPAISEMKLEPKLHVAQKTGGFRTCLHDRTNLSFTCPICSTSTTLPHNEFEVGTAKCPTCTNATIGHFGACLTCKFPVYCCH